MRMLHVSGTMKATTAAVTTAVLLSACSGIADVPLPGGAAKGKTYNVTIIFDNVLDLAKQRASALTTSRSATSPASRSISSRRRSRSRS